MKTNQLMEFTEDVGSMLANSRFDITLEGNDAVKAVAVICASIVSMFGMVLYAKNKGIRLWEDVA